MTSFPRLSYACPIPWASMRGDERERYCSKCARSVVNVSLLTHDQREALLANPPPGGLCVSYYQRLSGEMVSAENPLTPAESGRVVQWGVAALSLGAVALAANITPNTHESLTRAKDTTATTITAVCHEVTTRGRAAVDYVADQLGLKPKPAPVVSVFLGMTACPIPPPSPALAPAGMTNPPASAPASAPPSASAPDAASAPPAPPPGINQT